MQGYNKPKDKPITVIALCVTVIVCVVIVAYSVMTNRSAEPGESVEYTWYAVDSQNSMTYELESKPKWRGNTLRLTHKNNIIWINGGWTVYKMQNR